VSPGTTGGDAAVDAIGDRDGDGIADDVDNCPHVANPDQGNEDGDRFGDACDPCPPIADDNPPDADGDGVADACDPSLMSQDTIVLFEGFHHGIPATWTATGQWVADTDGVTISTSGAATLATPIASTDQTTIAAGLEAVALLGGNPDVDVANPLSANDVVSCSLFSTDPNGTNAALSLFDDSTGAKLAELPTPWVTGTHYNVGLIRNGSNYDCVSPDALPGQAVKATYATNATSPVVGLRAHNVTARYEWVMVIVGK
jgi:hypothetical protein